MPLAVDGRLETSQQNRKVPASAGGAVHDPRIVGGNINDVRVNRLNFDLTVFVL
jgi:hypothetical protein